MWTRNERFVYLALRNPFQSLTDPANKYDKVECPFHAIMTNWCSTPNRRG